MSVLVKTQATNNYRGTSTDQLKLPPQVFEQEEESVVLDLANPLQPNNVEPLRIHHTGLGQLYTWSHPTPKPGRNIPTIDQVAIAFIFHDECLASLRTRSG